MRTPKLHSVRADDAQLGQPRNTKRPLLAASVFAISALILSGCAATAPESTTPGTADVDVTAAVEAAKAAVVEGMKRPTTLSILQLPEKPAPGGVIDVISCSVPSCQEFATIVAGAIEPLGWTVKFISAGITTESLAAAYDQALRDKPNGVIGSGGFDPKLVVRQLADLEAAGIPVVMQYASAEEPIPGLTAIVYGSGAAEANGTLLGNAILADSNGEGANVLYLGTQEVANNYKWTRTGAKSVLEAPNSCNRCTSKVFDFTLSQIGGDLPGLLVSYLRANPDINYVVADFADPLNGVPQALAQAGLDDKVKVLSNGVGAITAEYLKAGQIFAGAYNPNLEVLWNDAAVIFAINQGVDLGLDSRGEVANLPAMLITQENVVLPPADSYWPMVENYQELFWKAWKVS